MKQIKTAADWAVTAVQIGCCIYMAFLAIILAGSSPTSGLGAASFDGPPPIPGLLWFKKMGIAALIMWSATKARKFTAPPEPKP